LFGVPFSAGGKITRTIDGMDVVLNRGVTTQRWTFIIGKDGRLKYINQEVDAANDYKAVMEALGSK
jgi:peroxiredoxin Q/BCP